MRMRSWSSEVEVTEMNEGVSDDIVRVDYVYPHQFRTFLLFFFFFGFPLFMSCILGGRPGIRDYLDKRIRTWYSHVEAMERGELDFFLLFPNFTI